MANEFSVAIHDFISARIADGQKNKAHAEKNHDAAAVSYYEGQLQELNAIRHYLVENVDLKTQKYF